MKKKIRRRIRVYKVALHKGIYYITNFTQTIAKEPTKLVQNNFRFKSLNSFDKLSTLEADFAISKSLYTAKSFIENGNKCKPHAFTNETQYINSLKLEAFDQNVDMDVDVVEGDWTLGCDCDRADHESDMVFCSTCAKWYHYACIHMGINDIPSEDLEWLCRGCGGSEYFGKDFRIPRIKQKRKKIKFKQFSSAKEAIESSTKSTNLLIGLYRHVLIDLNIIRMFILSLYGANRNITLENPKFEPESSNNYELVPNFNQQSSSQMFTTWIDHVKEFCSQDVIITPDHTTLDSIFKTLALSLKKDLMLSMLNWNAKNNLLLKRVKKWAKLLKPDITDKQDYPVCLKIVLCHLYSLMDLQCETSEGATLKELKKEYYQRIKSANAGSTASTPGLSNNNQLSFPDINSFNLSFKDCIDAPREYGLKVLMNDFEPITIKTTALQVFIIKQLEPKMKKINLENTTIRCIWSMLDIYSDFSSDNAINKLISDKFDDNPAYSKLDLVKDTVCSFSKNLREFGISFSGGSIFERAPSIEKAEILDFACIYKLLENSISSLVPIFTGDDRANIWNKVYGNLKSHLSNNRQSSRLFFSSYNGKASNPLENHFNQESVTDYGFLPLNPSKMTLTLLNMDGNASALILLDKIKTDASDVPLRDKQNLNHFRIKSSPQKKCSFVRITGFGVCIDNIWYDYPLKSPYDYVLPHKSNVSPLVDPFSILLRPGYGQLGLVDGKVKLNIPIAEKRVFQSMKNEEEYILY